MDSQKERFVGVLPTRYTVNMQNAIRWCVANVCWNAEYMILHGGIPGAIGGEFDIETDIHKELCEKPDIYVDVMTYHRFMDNQGNVGEGTTNGGIQNAENCPAK